MRIRLSPHCQLNLDYTLCCGQAFRWEKKGEWWYGIAKDTALKIRQIGSELEFENAEAGFIRHYLGLDDDLQNIFHQIGKDEHIRAAIKRSMGLRVLRQDPWECLISYICATYKNIPAIKQMLSRLAWRFGKKISFDDETFYSFPSPADLARATLRDLEKCGLGYRARYVRETTKMTREEYSDFERLKKEPYERARKALLRFPGVGPKVADCVLLFSLEKLDAFPVDVWIRRVILKHYADHLSAKFVKGISCKASLSDSEYQKLNMFGREHFGEYAGYAQEYLYHYERTRMQAAGSHESPIENKMLSRARLP